MTGTTRSVEIIEQPVDLHVPNERRSDDSYEIFV